MITVGNKDQEFFVHDPVFHAKDFFIEIGLGVEPSALKDFPLIRALKSQFEILTGKGFSRVAYVETKISYMEVEAWRQRKFKKVSKELIPEEMRLVLDTKAEAWQKRVNPEGFKEPAAETPPPLKLNIVNYVNPFTPEGFALYKKKRDALYQEKELIDMYYRDLNDREEKYNTLLKDYDAYFDLEKKREELEETIRLKTKDLERPEHSPEYVSPNLTESAVDKAHALIVKKVTDFYSSRPLSQHDRKEMIAQGCKHVYFVMYNSFCKLEEVQEKLVDLYEEFASDPQYRLSSPWWEKLKQLAAWANLNRKEYISKIGLGPLFLSCLEKEIDGIDFDTPVRSLVNSSRI